MFRKLIGGLLLAGGLCRAGLVITKSADGYQFAEAVSISVNGKDKLHAIGVLPQLTQPINKYPQTALNATLVKNIRSSGVGILDKASLNFLAPEPQGKTAPSDLAGLWAPAVLAYKKTQQDKTPTAVPVASFVGYVPGGTEELLKICQDLGGFIAAYAGKDAALATQLELLASAIKAFPTDANVAKLEPFVLESMSGRYARFENGTAGVEALQESLKFADLSQSVYPSKPEQDKWRKQVRDRRAWLDRKLAVLKAFTAGEQWDAFLLASSDVEKYERSFPELVTQRTKALRESMAVHQLAGKARLAEKDYGGAHKELSAALLRRPSDGDLEQEVERAWSAYSRQAALDRQGKSKPRSDSDLDVMRKNIFFANEFAKEKNLDEALKSIRLAEAVDRDFLDVLFTKADILAQRGEITEALKTLDRYDLIAVDRERDRAADLRNKLLFAIRSSVTKARTQSAAAWDAGRFVTARQAALDGLKAKDTEPELLYWSGISLMATHRGADGRQRLARYLELSNNLDGKSDQRAQVRNYLTLPETPIPSKAGETNWMSALPLNPNVFYCPVSLSFQPKIDRVVANKFNVTFQWEGNKLKSITPEFEKGERPTGEKKLLFSYTNDQVPQIFQARAEELPKDATPTEADEAIRSADLVLLNNPNVDPAAVLRLTGKNISVGIAGNSVFDPFVWDKIHYFQFEYDEAGRVRRARELSTRNGPALPFLVEFEWNGLRLQAIRRYQVDNGDRGTLTYERRMLYQDDKLVSEDVVSQGKSVAKTVYTYTGGRLTSATTERDRNLDDRARKVTFR